MWGLPPREGGLCSYGMRLSSVNSLSALFLVVNALGPGSLNLDQSSVCAHGQHHSAWLQVWHLAPRAAHRAGEALGWAAQHQADNDVVLVVRQQSAVSSRSRRPVLRDPQLPVSNSRPSTWWKFTSTRIYIAGDLQGPVLVLHLIPEPGISTREIPVGFYRPNILLYRKGESWSVEIFRINSPRNTRPV